MAIGYVSDDGKLVLYTYWKELGYGKGRKGNWWALRAFGALADTQENTEYGFIDRWVFPISCLEAVKRILAERRTELAVASQAECERLLNSKASRATGYTVILHPWEDRQSYTVTVPALPGCVTQGSTKEEALANVREAILCPIEGLKKAGEPIPSEESPPELARVSL